jgi:hypothetical protein
MTLLEWVKKQDEGAEKPNAISRLQQATRLAYTTVHAVVHGGQCKAETAKKLSDATGGEVSAADIILQSLSRAASEPERVAS